MGWNQMKWKEIKWNETEQISYPWEASQFLSFLFDSEWKLSQQNEIWKVWPVLKSSWSMFSKRFQITWGFFLISSVSYEKNCVLFFNFPSSLPSGLSPQTCSIVCLLPKYYNLSFLSWCNQLLILCWKHDE